MAKRPIFQAMTEKPGVIIHNLDFQWFPGFSLAQKQRSIQALHRAGHDVGLTSIIEISTKSTAEHGVKASAFNLSYRDDSCEMPLECAFQGSKVFDDNGQINGPYPDIYIMTGREAKKTIADRHIGNIIHFNFKNEIFPAKPLTFFYDWLYINALYRDESLFDEIMTYTAFSDIEFNPVKSINCQAFSAALAVSLYHNGKLEKAISSKDNFLNLAEEIYATRALPA